MLSWTLNLPGENMRFGKLEINPAKNPAILDTATWDQAAAWTAVQAVDDAYWPALRSVASGEAAGHDLPLPDAAGLAPWMASCSWLQGVLYCLAELPDGQQILLEVGDSLGAGLGPSPMQRRAGQHTSVALHPTSAAVLERYFRCVAADQGPRALGAVPRLGIGTRMTTAVWPAIWQAMASGSFAANAIQNSVRELNLLETLLEGRPAEKNIAFGFGTIETGYTGSSYEGLWVAGVLDALKHGVRLPYGADADHIQVKRGADGLARARRLLDATRYYSFYTLDVSDVLDYGALSAGPATASAYLEARLPDAAHRREALAYHRQPRRFGGFDYCPNDASLGRLVGKYWAALDAVGAMYEYISRLKDGASFDLELSIDEHPNDVPTFDCLTSETELIFVLLEAQRRGIPLTHVAPNFGVEKGTDYRGADGLDGFEARVRCQCRLTEEFGIMPDFHSGDDLSAATRRAIGRATGGRNQFKVSPMLQLLFAEVLTSYHPDLFRRWWEDALTYAQREASAGSAFAAECIRNSDISKPSSHDEVFHHFSFAFVGRRDTAGQFTVRETFYNLSPAFHQAYQQCIVTYLLELAEDLLLCA